MYKIAVCDDDPEVLSYISKLLKEYFESKDVLYIIDIFSSGKEILKRINTYNIFILDIQMDINGIDIARNIRNFSNLSTIIFMSNYNEFYHKAFEVHAFSYLLKPIKKSRLLIILDETIKLIEKKENDSTICLEIDNQIIKVGIYSIYYFESLARKLIIYTMYGKFETTYRLKDIVNLKKIEFFMLHKSFIVNLEHVISVKGYEVIMANNNRVPLAQKKSVEFKRALNTYLQYKYSKI